jgi:hypothetical protein
MKKDHVLTILRQDGIGADLLDWIAFQMIENSDWERTSKSRTAMAKSISKKVLELAKKKPNERG